MGAFAQAGKYKIYYEQAGEAGESIVLVHGFPTSSFLWRHVQKLLAEHHRVYAIDMLGFGKSDKPADVTYTLHKHAEVIHGLLDTLGLDEVVLTGHDWGGAVSQVFACTYPQRLRRLILMDCVAYDYWPSMEVLRLRALENVPDALFESPMVGGNWGGLRDCVHHKNRFPDVILRKYVEPWQGADGMRALVRVACGPSNEETMGLDLSKITVPTLVLWATEDPFMPMEIMYRLKQDLGGPVRLGRITEAGHYLQEDRPEEVAFVMHDFLTEWASLP